MTDKHPSRRAWPDTPPPSEWAPATHTHRQPRLPLVTAYVAIALLFVEAVLIFVFILNRGAYRDDEIHRIDDRINHSLCDLLDQLPEGGLLDRPRDKYGCGPGLPTDIAPPIGPP